MEVKEFFMSGFFRTIFRILKTVKADTHLWCLSVIGAAIVLCMSFFVEPSERQLILQDDSDSLSVARQIVIEYSSVLGSLSNIERLEEDDVDKIVEAIPDHVEDVADVVDDSCEEEINMYILEHSSDMVVTNDGEVDITHTYAQEDIDALERLVQCEAASEDEDGRMLVAKVVLNRVDTGIWGDDIRSVIESPGQFNPVSNGAVKTVTVDQMTKNAVISALACEDISKGAIYFQKSPQKVWGDKEYLFRHGSHSFYK